MYWKNIILGGLISRWHLTELIIIVPHMPPFWEASFTYETEVQPHPKMQRNPPEIPNSRLQSARIPHSRTKNKPKLKNSQPKPPTPNPQFQVNNRIIKVNYELSSFFTLFVLIRM
jgi:hypothetical protein